MKRNSLQQQQGSTHDYTHQMHLLDPEEDGDQYYDYESEQQQQSCSSDEDQDEEDIELEDDVEEGKNVNSMAILPQPRAPLTLREMLMRQKPLKKEGA